MSARLLKDPATVNSRVFVGHLQTEDMTKHELEEHFSKYGTVVGSLINRGFGFVQFEDEQTAQKAIQNENGSTFKGRRIDVRPAKKDSQGGAMNMGGPNSGGGDAQGVNNQFSPAKNKFGGGNDSFSGASHNFGGNQNFGARNPNFGKVGPQNQFGDGNQNQGGNEQQFGGQNRGGHVQFGGGQNMNRGGHNQFGGGPNQARPGFGQNRNQPNQGGNQLSTGGGGPGGLMGPGAPMGLGGAAAANRLRGGRGGKNRNKNTRDNAPGGNFRDRSPLNRGGVGVAGGGGGGMGAGAPGGGGIGGGGGGGGVTGGGVVVRNEEMGGRGDWDVREQGDRGRSGNFGRDSFGESGNRSYDEFKGTGGGNRDAASNFGTTAGSTDFSSIGTEKNDCEIIVVNKALTEYAEAIEMRLKKMGLSVDLLFPNEDVPLSRVLGNIASRGCLYAVVVTHINQEHHSLTLNILHGLPQEHRNMPIEDAINLISRDFGNYKAGGRSVPLNTPFAAERHPDAVQVLLNMLADNHQLTVLQYDRVIKYLEVKREEQVQVELGDVKDLPGAVPMVVSDPKQAELQSRILNILNSNKTATSAPAPSPVPAPAPVPPAQWGTAPTTSAPATTATATGVTPSPLLNDPTVQKALDSLLQGNLLKNIGDQQPPAAATPLFAAFPNIGRF